MRERVLAWPVDGPLDAERVFVEHCAGAEHAFWLDTAGPAADGVPQWSLLGTADVAIDAERIREEARGGSGGVLDRIRSELRDLAHVDASEAPGPFALGLIGWLGFELFEETLGLPPVGPRRHPDALLMRADRAIAIDHGAGDRGWLLARGAEWSGELAQWRDAMLARLAEPPTAAEGLSDPAAGALALAPRRAVWATSEGEYLARIRAAQRAIVEGEAYQLCLTTEARVDGVFDAIEVYRRLRRSSPAHHGGLLISGGTALLSASPERFLAGDPQGRVETRPIKGTRPRGADLARDEALADELLASDKERAENLMIVDLMRNDLARVCELGSVAVTGLLEVESYPHVHQLVSTVRGRLRAGLDAVDLIRACFPAGSMTGAPKRSAVRILGELERRPRGVYSGVFGHLGVDGRLDLAMVIRSIVLDAAGAVIGAGGGITALSVPEEEVAEVRLKAAALLDALGAE